VIIALGEVVVAIGAPVVETLSEGEGLGGSLLTALTSSGLLAGILWWSYFDRPLPALELRHEALTDPKERSRFARDVYTYNHLIIVGSILTAAAALEEIMLHPADPLPDAFRWMLFIGISGYLLGVALSVLRAYASLAVERLLGVLALGVFIALSPSLPGMWILIGIDALLVAVLAIEHYRVEVAGRFVPVKPKHSDARPTPATDA
jgi:low temperature requirement protein LtrA